MPDYITSHPQPDPPGAAKRKLVANERLKITATLLNNAAAAALVTGVIAPVVAALYGASLPRSPYWLLVGLGSVIVAAGLHVTARRVLGAMEP